MSKHSKRYRALAEKVAGNLEPTGYQEAIASIKGLAGAKFDEAVEVAVRLGVDTRKSDQAVRGTAPMPAGTGKSVRVAALCQGKQAEAAVAAGADLVGFEDLLESIGAGKFEFDVLISVPEAMHKLAAHGRVLGPKGLMPNPKSGTVTANVGEAVKRAKAGEVRFRADKGGIIHAAIGRASFAAADLEANFLALIDALKKAKPPSAKGQYLQSATIALTMSPGLPVDIAALR